MKQQNCKTKFIGGFSILAIFILFTIFLKLIDVQPTGVNGSSIAFSGLNHAVHSFLGVNMFLYTITDWAGIVVLLFVLGFGILGLFQWIQRKSICKVDSSILALGGFYIIVLSVFFFFETFPVNYRPVLIDGAMEASYPSSTTMLAMCVLPTAMIQFYRLISNRKLMYIINSFCGIFTVFLVVGRIFSGVHWITDILGGLLFSTGMVLIYSGTCDFLNNKINCLNKR